jgi:hypothetical protein
LFLKEKLLYPQPPDNYFYTFLLSVSRKDWGRAIELKETLSEAQTSRDC